MSYEPKPIETSSVQLPPDLNEMTERLAENTHDIWAAKRLADGWRYGPYRDDRTKRHPCLVPYSELPENEKAYDRQIVIETLKAIYVLGYGIRITDL